MDIQVLKVLLVEDDEDDYIVIRNMLLELAPTEYELQWITSFDSAIEEMTQSRQDVCLLDYRLEDRDGLELLTELMRKGCRIPVIFLTGAGDRRVDIDAMKRGAVDYLVKGDLSPELLERSIRYAVERRRVEDALRDQAERLERANNQYAAAIHELRITQDQLRAQNAEMQRAREALLVERQRYIDLFEHAPDGYVVTDTKGIIRELNHAASLLLGVDRETAKGESIVLLVADDDKRACLDQMGMIKHLRGVRDWEILLQPPGGTSFHASISITSVLPGDNERPALRWSIRDVTERKRTANELEKHRQRLEELVERRTRELNRAMREAGLKAMELDAALNSIADGVMIFGPNRELVRANSMAEHLLGYTPEKQKLSIEERVKTIRIQTLEGVDLSVEELPVMRAFRGETVVSQPLLVSVREGGRTRCISFSASPIRRQNGELNGVISTFTDMTAQMKATEEIRKARDELELRVQERTAQLTMANESLREEIEERKQAEAALLESQRELQYLSSRLLSVQEEERKRIARDIHDSLGSAMSAAKFAVERAIGELERGPGAPESLKAAVPVVQGAVEEARRIMSDLRPAILDDLGLLPAIGWFCRQCQLLHPEIHIEQDLDVDESEVPEHLRIVIFRVVQEALNNVCKYSKAEYVSVSLTAIGGAIELSVEDSGTGFDLHASLAYGGDQRRGFGLTSMKERTEFSGGSFTIHSVPGEGTKVSARWPLSHPSELPVEDRAEPGRHVSAPGPIL